MGWVAYSCFDLLSSYLTSLHDYSFGCQSFSNPGDQELEQNRHCWGRNNTNGCLNNQSRIGNQWILNNIPWCPAFIMIQQISDYPSSSPPTGKFPRTGRNTSGSLPKIFKLCQPQTFNQGLHQLPQSYISTGNCTSNRKSKWQHRDIQILLSAFNYGFREDFTE